MSAADITKYDLHLSESYRNATDKERAAYCNGCGARGGMPVPKTFWGLSMVDACNVHDWDYQHGATLADKQTADRFMLFNMLIIIEAQTGWYQTALKLMRRRRAMKYYEAVTMLGSKAFWANKVKPEKLT